MQLFVSRYYEFTIIKYYNGHFYRLHQFVNFESSPVSITLKLQPALLENCILNLVENKFVAFNKYHKTNICIPILFNKNYILFINGRAANSLVVFSYLVNINYKFGYMNVTTKKIINKLKYYTKIYDKQIRLKYLPTLYQQFSSNYQVVDNLNIIPYMYSNK